MKEVIIYKKTTVLEMYDAEEYVQGLDSVKETIKYFENLGVKVSKSEIYRALKTQSLIDDEYTVHRVDLS